METLNLEYNRQLLLIRALNKYKFKARGFSALGVTERTGYNLVKYHEIQWSEEKGYYSEKVVEFKK